MDQQPDLNPNQDQITDESNQQDLQILQELEERLENLTNENQKLKNGLQASE